MSSDIKVIDKAFKIIGCFDEKNKSASLKQIALITKLNIILLLSDSYVNNS